MPTKYTLTADIISNRKDSKGNNIIYAKKGITVTEVSAHGEVVIVKDDKGNRFPAHITKLKKQ